MLKHLTIVAAALLMTSGCSDNAPDQAAIDAAVEKALAERDREDAAKYRESQAAANQPAVITAEQAEAAEAEAEAQRTASGGRVVTCTFEDQRYGYDGKCRFVAGPGGDFQATALEGNYFEDVSRIDHDVIAPKRGSLIINYTTGPVLVPVSREPRDKACWSNSAVRFCAR